MSFSERWSAFWGDDVDKALAGKDFVIVTLRDYYYHEYAIDMRQIRELLKEESNLASQRAAVNAGFRVAWVELLAEAKI